MLNNSKWISYPTKEDYTCPVFKKNFTFSKEIKKRPKEQTLETSKKHTRGTTQITAEKPSLRAPASPIP